MKDKIERVRLRAEDIARGSGYSWFIGSHLELVLENAAFLCSRLPEASRDVVMLSAWLHDIIYFIDISKEEFHAELGAIEAARMMQEEGLPEEFIEKVAEAIRCHSCKREMPQSLEAKILATADAMSHFSPKFFLSLAIHDDEFKNKGVDGFMEFARKKLERDFGGSKFFFDFAKEEVRGRYEKIKAFLEI